MSWCDKLASTPTVGFGLETEFASADALINAMSPITSRLGTGEKPQFSVERHDSFNLTIATDEGFQYGLEPSKAFVRFVYRMRAKQTSAGPPVVELLSKARPYTQLLPQVMEKLIEATLSLPNARKRSITRIGIVSETRVSLDEAPPGIKDFIRYVGTPWKAKLNDFSFKIVSSLGDGPRGKDECIHTISKSAGDDELVLIHLDWVRTLPTSRPIDQRVLPEITIAAQRSALAYFEEVAIGSMFDEES